MLSGTPQRPHPDERSSGLLCGLCWAGLPQLACFAKKAELVPACFFLHFRLLEARLGIKIQVESRGSGQQLMQQDARSNRHIQAVQLGQVTPALQACHLDQLRTGALDIGPADSRCSSETQYEGGLLWKPPVTMTDKRT